MDILYHSNQSAERRCVSKVFSIAPSGGGFRRVFSAAKKALVDTSLLRWIEQCDRKDYPHSQAQTRWWLPKNMHESLYINQTKQMIKCSHFPLKCLCNWKQETVGVNENLTRLKCVLDSKSLYLCGLPILTLEYLRKLLNSGNRKTKLLVSFLEIFNTHTCTHTHTQQIPRLCDESQGQRTLWRCFCLPPTKNKNIQ